jgi:hypothetical protein
MAAPFRESIAHSRSRSAAPKPRQRPVVVPRGNGIYFVDDGTDTLRVLRSPGPVECGSAAVIMVERSLSRSELELMQDGADRDADRGADRDDRHELECSSQRATDGVARFRRSKAKRDKGG